jgi:hypothetical protein
MTATATPATGGTATSHAGPTSHATAPRVPPRRRLLVWALVVLAVALASALLAGLRGPNTLPLDPDNPEDDGMQAIARVLEQQGVEVDVARSLGELQRTPVDGGTRVLVVGTAFLSPDSGARVLEHVRDADALLVLGPGRNTGEVLDLPVTVDSWGQRGTVLEPHCDSPTWRADDTLTGADALIEVTGDLAGAVACFPPSAGFGAGGATAGHVVEMPASGDRPRTLVLGIAPALTNAMVLEEANAAVGLRLLGGADRLVWYIPSVADAGEQAPQSLIDVLPEAVVPSVALLLAALGAAMVWRGRRLGPVVTEPLPAVIRSVETTQSRARLYRRAGDRRRALAALQLAARRRLATRLGLSRHAPTEAVVQAVARASGRHTEEIRRVLADPTADDDETLVRTARELRALEEGMRSV